MTLAKRKEWDKSASLLNQKIKTFKSNDEFGYCLSHIQYLNRLDFLNPVQENGWML